MKQFEAVIKVMEENGGFATLGHLYQEALEVPNVEWKSKTPFASIRRIVQVRNEIFKIRPGLWALESWRDKLPIHIQNQSNQSNSSSINENTHSHYQGLLVEIGNLRDLSTFIPAQDKNKPYLNNTLGRITTLKDFYNFSYPEIVDRARTIDVVWFNKRRLPNAMFEVEHSTDMQNSLLKFVQLQDFEIGFYIVANDIRKRHFQNKIDLHAFTQIKHRVKFLSYHQVDQWHTKMTELVLIERGIGI